MQFNVALLLAAVASVVSAQTASTGVITAPTPTGSPIFTGAASVNGVSAFGLVVAGGLALVI